GVAGGAAGLGFGLLTAGGACLWAGALTAAGLKVTRLSPRCAASVRCVDLCACAGRELYCDLPTGAAGDGLEVVVGFAGCDEVAGAVSARRVPIWYLIASSTTFAGSYNCDRLMT